MPELDENTGLPALPDGYFWRVRYEGVYGDYVKMSVMRKPKYRFLWSWAVEDARLYASIFTDDNAEELLIKLAGRVHARFIETLRPSSYQTVKKYLGDYPPKSLNEHG